jgi:RNA 3'-terminal phosphate cyclase (ATP)
LQPQHLTAIHAAATISNARVEGAMLGSTELRFEPNEVTGGEFLFDIEDISGQGSAGAVMLVAQTVLLPLALKGQSAKLTILGGTHVGWSPGTDYVEFVYLPALRHFGVNARVETLEGGFYPRGGGRAVCMSNLRSCPSSPSIGANAANSRRYGSSSRYRTCLKTSCGGAIRRRRRSWG